MRRLTIAIAGMLTLGLTASAGAATPSDWIEVAAGPMFTVQAPPGTTFERVRTGDAFAGSFHGPGFDLAVEFGYHREELKNPDGAMNPKAEKAVFDDKPGTITTAGMTDPAHPYFVGLHVPAVENDVFGPLSLVVTTQVARPEDQATVERIYQTVKFGYKN
jgi:hypothetical protein